MDPITHGIAGSLLGKSFFGKQYGRTAIFAATLGAVFPDVDTVADVVTQDPLAIVTYHRGITHSWFGLPFFAAALAWLTRRVGRRFGFEVPPWPILALIYGVGIASHILMDGTTSFGTRMWTPFSQRRVAWDFVFIIDLIFTSLLLAPQVAAWIYSDRRRWLSRALRMWILFTLGAVGGWAVARAASFPFHAWIVACASVCFGLLFFLPATFGEGAFRLRREMWCSVGLVAALAYVAVCASAHHAALRQVEQFAEANHITVERIGALPLAPSLMVWGVGIRSTNGVFESQFDLRRSDQEAFTYTPDSPADLYSARALTLKSVQAFWNFSRFPTMRRSDEGSQHLVDIGENRFMNRRRGPQPFTYRVAFDDAGNPVEEGMSADGMFLRRMKPAESSGRPRNDNNQP